MYNFKKRYLAVACSAIWIAGCNSGGGSSNNTPATTHCNPCTMFVTESTFTSNLLESAVALNYTGESIGVYAADYLCGRDASKPTDGHTYKAFIVDGVNRIACTSPNCANYGESENKNWVLYPNTQYSFTNGNPIFRGTTNSSAIYLYGTLQSASPYPTSMTYWTGFGDPHLQPWVSPAAASSNCSAWSANVPTTLRGNFGQLLVGANTLTVFADHGLQQTTAMAAQHFNAGLQFRTCNAEEHLLCVMQ